MKTLTTVILFLCLAINNVMADGWELYAGYLNRPADTQSDSFSLYKIRVVPLAEEGVYDSLFKLVLPGDPDLNFIEKTLQVKLNANWPCTNDPIGTDGTLHYGKYRIEFRSEFGVKFSEAFIDFRDGDYGYNAQGNCVGSGSGRYYNDVDFDVYYDFDLGHPVLKWAGILKSIPMQEYAWTIWEEANKSQNTAKFENFKLSSLGLENHDVFQFKIGNHVYIGNGTFDIDTAVGFSQNVPIELPNSLPILDAYGEYTGEYCFFTSWHDGATYNPTSDLNNYGKIIRTLAVGTSPVRAVGRYKPNDQFVSISGRTQFIQKGVHTYTANTNGGSIQFNWFVKFDFNNTWQALSGSQNVNVSVAFLSHAYDFYLRCYVYDLADSIWTYSQLRVTCGACGGPDPLAFSHDDRVDDNNELSSINWWPVNPDVLTKSEKIRILLPIRSILMDLKHKFRWKDSDSWVLPPDSTDYTLALAHDKEFIDTEQKSIKDTSCSASSEELLTEKLNVLAKPVLQTYSEGPTEFSMKQNFPNPFNPTTTIQYSLDQDGIIKLSVYNILGQKVVSLQEGFKTRGVYEVAWDGRNGNGQLLPSGVYIYRLQLNERIISKKLNLTK